MGGLLFFGALLVWVAAVIWLARRLSRATKVRPPLRHVVTCALAIVIVFLPVADEVASKPYFEWLCHRGAIVNIAADKVRGKAMRLTFEPSDAPVTGTPIRISRDHYVYRDAVTGEALIQFDTYQAEGGVLARAIGMTRGRPVTGTFYCAPEQRMSMQKQYGFVVLN